jgi:hypothetical protein
VEHLVVNAADVPFLRALAGGAVPHQAIDGARWCGQRTTAT